MNVSKENFTLTANRASTMAPLFMLANEFVAKTNLADIMAEFGANVMIGLGKQVLKCEFVYDPEIWKFPEAWKNFSEAMNTKLVMSDDDKAEFLRAINNNPELNMAFTVINEMGKGGGAPVKGFKKLQKRFEEAEGVIQLQKDEISRLQLVNKDLAQSQLGLGKEALGKLQTEHNALIKRYDVCRHELEEFIHTSNSLRDQLAAALKAGNAPTEVVLPFKKPEGKKNVISIDLEKASISEIKAARRLLNKGLVKAAKKKEKEIGAPFLKAMLAVAGNKPKVDKKAVEDAMKSYLRGNISLKEMNALKDQAIQYQS
jgi:hypothetical protein